MVLYDDKKRLLAIDEEILEILGYESIESFDKDDISELFIKKPGYIYNFSGLSWIDFIYANTSREHKAIIKSKNGAETEVELNIKRLLSPKGKTFFLIELNPVLTDTSINEKESMFFNEDSYNDTSYNDTYTTNSSFSPDFEDIDSEITLLKEDTPTTKEEPLIFEESEPISFTTIQNDTTANETAESKEAEVEKIDYSLDKDIDISKAAQELGISEEELKEIIKEHFENMLLKKDMVFDMINSENLSELSNIIHDFTGSNKNLRLYPLVNILESQKPLKEKFEEFYNKVEQLNSKLFNQTPLSFEYMQVEFNQPEPIIESGFINESIEDDKEIIDIEKEIKKAQKILGIDKTEYKNFLNEFLKEAKKSDILNQKDAKKIRSLAMHLHLDDFVDSIKEKDVERFNQLISKYQKATERI